MKYAALILIGLLLLSGCVEEVRIYGEDVKKTPTPTPTATPTPIPTISPDTKEVSFDKVVDNKTISVTVGDTTKSAITPQLKLTKDTAELSTSIDSVDYGTFSGTADKLSWDKSDTIINLYEFPVGSKEAPEGGFEYEVVFKSRPSLNTVSFKLDLTNLEYFYQPPLNIEKNNLSCNATHCENATRPENVVGSYAFYKVNGGKAFHLYRPLITDAKGNKIWGTLDIKDSVLTLTIDNKWLDTATYPVIVDPTWGYTTTPSSEDAWASVAFGYRFTAPDDIDDAGTTLLSIHTYQKDDSGSRNIKGAIWKVSDRTLVANSVTGATSVSTSYAWRYTNFSTSPSLTAGTTYYIGFVTDPIENMYWKYDAGSSGYAIYGSTTYASPGTITSYANFDQKPGIYITYTTGAGGDTTPPASINGLANSTTCNSINFTWTNPGGDQNETVIWKDNALYKNVSNTTTFEEFTGLNGWKSYTFSSKTKDIAGNLNETWVNMTAQTSPICIIEGILRNWFWRLPTEMMR